VAAAVAAASGWVGLAISWDASVHHDVNLPAGATVVVLLTAVFAVVALARAALRRRGDRSSLDAGTGAGGGPVPPVMAPEPVR
jgi:manganese/iron transport system permease protein